MYSMFGPAEEALDREALIALELSVVLCLCGLILNVILVAGEAELCCEARAPSPGGCESTASTASKREECLRMLSAPSARIPTWSTGISLLLSITQPNSTRSIETQSCFIVPISLNSLTLLRGLIRYCTTSGTGRA